MCVLLVMIRLVMIFFGCWLCVRVILFSVFLISGCSVVVLKVSSVILLGFLMIRWVFFFVVGVCILVSVWVCSLGCFSCVIYCLMFLVCIYSGIEVLKLVEFVG